MQNVRDVLRRKGSDVWSVHPETSIFDALKLMADKNIGAVLVTDRLGKPVGIFSERDYARKVVLKGKRSQATPVSEVMTEGVLTVSPARAIDECMTLMIEKRVRHLPVVQEETVVGMISIGDVLKAALADREALIEQLEEYITHPY